MIACELIMFLRENEMAPAVARWLVACDLHVKREFVTPWGICDLVAANFNENSVSHRLALGQKKSIRSLTRAILLLKVPDLESGRSVSLKKLVNDCSVSLSETKVKEELERLLGDKFLVRTKRGSLQKLNGWMPLHDRLVAVELKLSRIEEAMNQAKQNLGLGGESYVAFPAEVSKRILAKSEPWAKYFDAGVGILSVTKRTCVVVKQSRPTSAKIDSALQLYAVDKFWQSRSRDN
jgi:hypothetical protein